MKKKVFYGGVEGFCQFKNQKIEKDDFFMQRLMGCALFLKKMKRVVLNSVPRFVLGETNDKRGSGSGFV